MRMRRVVEARRSERRSAGGGGILGSSDARCARRLSELLPLPAAFWHISPNKKATSVLR